MWLYAEENLPEHYAADFSQLRKAKLKTARAWAIKEGPSGFQVASDRARWPDRVAGEGAT
jgi:hypothetical protein